MEARNATRPEPRPGLGRLRPVPADRPTETTPTEPVRDGLFFTLPEPLPRGRHKLTDGQVLAAQRERLLAAMTELLAARGYRGFGAGEVASRAGVSLAAFYDCFENKDACVFAGYDRFIEVLLTRMTSVDVAGKTSPAIVEALLRTYLDTLQSDLVVARAYQVEIDALGPPARERRRDSLKQFAALIREQLARTYPNGEPPATLTSSAYLGIVYAARQLASDALDETTEPDLISLGDNIEVWFSDLFRKR
jgi:AcrR family transcriptional regulator